MENIKLSPLSQNELKQIEGGCELLCVGALFFIAGVVTGNLIWG